MSVNAVYSVLAQAALVVGGVLLAALVPGALALGCLIVWWFVLIEMPAALRHYVRHVRPVPADDDAAAYLFISERNARPYDPDSVTAAFGRWRRALGLPHLHPHVTRHTYATGYLLAGGDIAVLSALLGHSALNTTLGYAHLRDTTVVVELQGRSSPIDARLGGTTQQRVSGQQTLSGDVFARHEQAIKRLRRANHA